MEIENFSFQVRLTGRYLSLGHQSQSAVLSKVAVEVWFQLEIICFDLICLEIYK